ncbi:lysozyme [Allokutzneria albata]|uniref:Lysozyme n=1 Tax=Allokutzneria albata TaxID=211114 RepID=A0A1H0AFN5_ALLAB|nr:lysozyme [Allokutzneria albata]SDN32225.1 lysozyme [Allokutzneria albata]
MSVSTRTARSAVAVAALVAALGFSALAPAGADPIVGNPDVPVGDTAMGSQIAKHEGLAPDRARNLTDPAPTDPQIMASVAGIDVSGHQGNVNWQAQWNAGKRFAYVKATEGTGYKNPYFAQQYNGSYNIGMVRGSYHFALPDRSSGAAQANYFVNNGGGWSKDGKTLPGALDIEYNPYGATCYGLSQQAMVNWILDFSNTYKARTGRYPMIYTSTSWWSTCTGNRGDFSNTNPLWVARYASSVGALPHAWRFYTIWQYSETPIDQNTFNGAYDRLVAMANG